MRNMLEDDKTRLGLASGGNDSSILDKRLQAMIENEIKLVQEYGDDYFKSFQDKLKNMFPKNNPTSLGLVVVILLFIWTLSGFYRVGTDEQGVVTRFGEYVRTTEPGLHYHLPFPIE